MASDSSISSSAKRRMFTNRENGWLNTRKQSQSGDNDDGVRVVRMTGNEEEEEDGEEVDEVTKDGNGNKEKEEDSDNLENNSVKKSIDDIIAEERAKGRGNSNEGMTDFLADETPSTRRYSIFGMAFPWNQKDDDALSAASADGVVGDESPIEKDEKKEEEEGGENQKDEKEEEGEKNLKVNEEEEEEGENSKVDDDDDRATTDDSDNEKTTDDNEEEEKSADASDTKAENADSCEIQKQEPETDETDKTKADENSSEDKEKEDIKKQARRASRQNRTLTPPTRSLSSPSPYGMNPYLLFPSNMSPPILPGGIPPPNRFPPSQQQPQSPNNNLPILFRIIEPLIPILSRLLVLFVLKSLSGSIPPFGHRSMKERIHHPPSPGQHFMLERVNDRYRADDVALRMALECPPGVKGVWGQKGWKRVLRKRRKVLKKEKEVIGGGGGDGKGDGEGGSITEAEDNAVLLQSPTLENTKPTSGKSTTNTPSGQLYDRTVIILEIDTESHDIETKVLPQLRDAVSFLLHQYHDTTGARLYMGRELEILILVESPGGSVSDFGLAADQITRLRTASNDILNGEKHAPDLLVTVCVDRIAASGGYMIACQSSPDRLYAAPFAILGSIGVLRSNLNYHSLLSKYGVKPLLLTAGEAKAPLTSTSEVTDEKIAIAQRGLDRTHVAFRDMVESRRGGMINKKMGYGAVVREKIYEGDTFLGKDALGYGLVDRVVTSDEYVAERVRAGDRVLKLVKCEGKMGRLPSLLELLFLSNQLSEGGAAGGSRGVVGRRLVSKIGSQIGPLLKFGGVIGLTKFMDVFGNGNGIWNGRLGLDRLCHHHRHDDDVSYRG